MAADARGPHPPALLVALAGVLVDATGAVRPEVEALIDDVRAAGRAVGVITDAPRGPAGPPRAKEPSVLGRVDAVIDGPLRGAAGPAGGAPVAGGPGTTGPGSSGPGRGGSTDAGPGSARNAYERAAAALHRPRRDLVFVGDAVADVEAAVAAGLRSVWFDAADVADSVRRLRDALGLRGRAGGAHPAG